MKNLRSPESGQNSAPNCEAFSAILDAAADGMIVINQYGNVISFNKAAKKMFGYSADEVKGMNVSMLMSCDTATEHDGYIQRYLESGAPQIIGLGRQVEAKKSNGILFPVHLSVGEYVLNEKRYFIGILHDISGQVDQENENQKLRQHLTHIDRVNIMGEMASGIAHELNQPLTAISSYIQSGRRRLDAKSIDKTKINELLEKAEQQSLRAGKIIRRIRSLVQVTEVERVLEDINLLVKDAAEFSRMDAKRKNIDIDLDLSDQPCMCEADRIQIQQVLLNLIRNAMDAMEETNHEERQIIVRTERVEKDSLIRVSVRDFAGGVSEAVRDSLFEAFETTKKHGTGMGLSISRTIVQAHGGDITLETIDPGSLFVFTLPLESGGE